MVFILRLFKLSQKFPLLLFKVGYLNFNIDMVFSNGQMVARISVLGKTVNNMV
jgi:hypothetical protein